MERPTAPDLYPELRAAYYGPSGGPGPAPSQGVASADVLAEFHERLSPYLFAAQHPGSFSYFTPPPLPMAIVGETLAAWVNQGIDLWLAGMAAPFVEEEVTRWLCDLTGYGDGAWGILASGGVMANVMGLTVARDVHLAKLLGLDAAAPGRAARGRAHLRLRSGALLDRARRRHAGLPGVDAPRVAVGRPVPPARGDRRRRDRRGSRGRAHPVLHRPRRRIDQHRLGRPGGRACGPGRAGRALAPRGRRVRRSGTPVGARRRSRHGSGAGRLRHDRSAQVVLPAVRHRRVAREAPGGPAAHVPPGAGVLPGVGAGGPAAALVPVLARGDAAVPRAQALDVVEAPGIGRASPG